MLTCKNSDLRPVNLRFLQLHLAQNSSASAPPHLYGIALRSCRTYEVVAAYVNFLKGSRAETGVLLVVKLFLQDEIAR